MRIPVEEEGCTNRKIEEYCSRDSLGRYWVGGRKGFKCEGRTALKGELGRKA